MGKSTLSRKLIHALSQEKDWRVSGLSTLRTGPHDLEVLEIATGESYPITLPFDAEDTTLSLNFIFDPLAMSRSARAIEASFPTDIFILDEIGPLELLWKRGWARVLDLLKHESYRIGFIVVRPELLLEAVLQLPTTTYTVVNVTHENRDELPPILYRMVQRICLKEDQG